MAEDPGPPPALPPASCPLLPSIWPRIWLHPKVGVGGHRGWLTVSQLPLSPCSALDELRCLKLCTFPWGAPRPESGKGCLGTPPGRAIVPLSCGTSPESMSTSQALTISQPPPFGVPSPARRAANPQTWTLNSGPGCPKVPPTWRLQQRMVLPRASP